MADAVVPAVVEPSTGLAIESLPITALKPHPRNYRAHPDDQLAHIAASLKEHGVYRNVVIARDNTILAGHGVVKAAQRICMTELRCVRLDIDPESPAALRVLTGDNGIGRLAEQDDRMLTDLLRTLKEQDAAVGLIGTGYDEQMLAALVFVTRPSSEIASMNAAADWVGMPKFEAQGPGDQIIVHFGSPEARAEFGKLVGQDVDGKKFIHFPPKEKTDIMAHKLE